jgi:hypothetical protein
VNDQLGDYRFFVADAACPGDLLSAVLKHFEALGASESSGQEPRP